MAAEEQAERNDAVSETARTSEHAENNNAQQEVQQERESGNTASCADNYNQIRQNTAQLENDKQLPSLSIDGADTGSAGQAKSLGPKPEQGVPTAGRPENNTGTESAGVVQSGTDNPEQAQKQDAGSGVETPAGAGGRGRNESDANAPGSDHKSDSEKMLDDFAIDDAQSTTSSSHTSPALPEKDGSSDLGEKQDSHLQEGELRRNIDRADAGKDSASNADLAFPETADELKGMSGQETENLFRENQQKLEEKIAANSDRLPAAIGFHGGTRESQDLWYESKGKQMVPPGADEGNRENITWVGAVTQKSDDASVLAADIGDAARTAAGYANPHWIHGNYTPGSVAVMDLTPSMNSGNSNEFRTNKDYAPSDRVQIGNISNQTLSSNFDAMVAGDIPHSDFAHFDESLANLDRDTPEGVRKSYFTNALRSQYLSNRAVDIFIQRKEQPFA